MIELFREHRAAYDRVWYGSEHKSAEWKQDARELEYVLKLQGYMCLSRRPFAFPCRVICEIDLKRPHTTCMLACDLRKIHQGKMPSRIPVYAYTLWIHKGRRFEPVKAVLMKLLMTVFEVLAH